jgi:dihydrofolate synthase/folylpolyglutamate synthase
MQRLKAGPLIDAAPQAELWLDGGHNPAAGEAIAQMLAAGAARPAHLICGMLNTKDIEGYMTPLARVADSLHGVSIPGEEATLTADQTAAAARGAGLTAQSAQDVECAISEIIKTDPNARILICGSLYLAGHILRENS